MNKAFSFLLVLPAALILCCSGLENPFDSKSQNFVSDTTLVRIMREYDSTLIDTSIVYDTIVHIDTIILDSFRIVTQTRYDTSFAVDTLHFWDTLYHYDTLVHLDTSHIIDTFHILDTVRYFDTVHVKDTLHFYDTTTRYDTLTYRDTLTFIDTSHFLDTIHFLDTLYHYDTLVHRDTVIDTVRFYRTQPFIYLVELPDSSVFTTFGYGATHNLAAKAAGIDPSIIQGYSYMPYYGTVWNNVASPWVITSTTTNTTSPILYTLRVTTDSGFFANTYTIRCDPGSVLSGSKPSFKEVRVRTNTGVPASFDRTYSGYIPACTLWTDSAPFTPSADVIDYVHILMRFNLAGCDKFDIYASLNGSYNFVPDNLYDGLSWAEVELEHFPVPIGNSIVTANCRCVDPDTSQWSGWTSLFFIVRDGR